MKEKSATISACSWCMEPSALLEGEDVLVSLILEREIGQAELVRSAFLKRRMWYEKPHFFYINDAIQCQLSVSMIPGSIGIIFTVPSPDGAWKGHG